MTREEIQAARDWAARKMGWKLVDDWWVEPIPPCDMWPDGANHRHWHIDDWRPDTDANQCFMLVERMRELGWYLNYDNYMKPGAIFYRDDRREDIVKGRFTYLEDDDPLHAIIKAAMATEDK